MSDKFGRKKILLTGMISNMLFILSFGFSRNIYMAIASRVLVGLLNGSY